MEQDGETFRWRTMVPTHRDESATPGFRCCPRAAVLRFLILLFNLPAGTW